MLYNILFSDKKEMRLARFALLMGLLSLPALTLDLSTMANLMGISMLCVASLSVLLFSVIRDYNKSKPPSKTNVKYLLYISSPMILLTLDTIANGSLTLLSSPSIMRHPIALSSITTLAATAIAAIIASILYELVTKNGLKNLIFSELNEKLKDAEGAQEKIIKDKMITLLELGAALDPLTSPPSEKLSGFLRTVPDLANKTDKYGYPMLLRAVINRWNPAAVQALIDHGADVNAKTPSGNTPLMAAISCFYADLPLNLTLELLTRDTDPITKRTNLVDQLIQAPTIKINERNAKGETALMHCAGYQSFLAATMLKTLLMARADPNIESEREQTALHIALRAGQYDNIALLLQYKAEIPPDIKVRIDRLKKNGFVRTITDHPDYFDHGAVPAPEKVADYAGDGAAAASAAVPCAPPHAVAAACAPVAADGNAEGRSSSSSSSSESKEEEDEKKLSSAPVKRRQLEITGTQMDPLFHQQHHVIYNDQGRLLIPYTRKFLDKAATKIQSVMRGKLAVPKAQLERLSRAFEHIPRSLALIAPDQGPQPQHSEHQPAFAPESALVPYTPRKTQPGTLEHYQHSADKRNT